MLLSVAIFFSGIIIISDVFVTYQRTGVYVIVVHKMFSKDVLIMVLILIPFLFTFSLAMWPVLPTSRVYAVDDIYAYLSILWSMLFMTFSGGNTNLLLAGEITDLVTLTTPDFSLPFYDWRILRKIIPECASSHSQLAPASHSHPLRLHPNWRAASLDNLCCLDGTVILAAPRCVVQCWHCSSSSGSSSSLSCSCSTF